MRPDDFFVEEQDPIPGIPSTRRLNQDLILRIRSGPVDGIDDIEIAVALARLVHDELETYGTGGEALLNDAQIRDALLSLRMVADRIGIADFDVPFRDFTTFRSFWLKHDAYGSWQARRDLLSEIFDHAHDQLADLEAGALTSLLAEPVSPLGRTGWSRVDEEIAELRRHFKAARSRQDYRNVGNDCVIVTEALSAHVYDPMRHLREGEVEPPVAKTKLRLERAVEDALSGPESATLRKLVRAAIELAQEVKHRDHAGRREAGMAADSVILLANLLRRLDQ